MRSFSIVTSVMTLSSAQRPAVLNSDMTNVQANPVQANQHRMLRSMKNADAMESTVITPVGGMGRSLTTMPSPKKWMTTFTEILTNLWKRLMDWLSSFKKTKQASGEVMTSPKPDDAANANGVEVTTQNTGGVEDTANANGVEVTTQNTGGVEDTANANGVEVTTQNTGGGEDAAIADKVEVTKPSKWNPLNWSFFKKPSNVDEVIEEAAAPKLGKGPEVTEKVNTAPEVTEKAVDVPTNVDEGTSNVDGVKETTQT